MRAFSERFFRTCYSFKEIIISLPRTIPPLQPIEWKLLCLVDMKKQNAYLGIMRALEMNRMPSTSLFRPGLLRSGIL